MVGVIFVYVDAVYWFMGILFLCLIRCFSMINWTPTVLSVLYACVLYYCICTCSAQLSMFHMERRSRNTLTIIISSIIITFQQNFLVQLWSSAPHFQQRLQGGFRFVFLPLHPQNVAEVSSRHRTEGIPPGHAACLCLRCRAAPRR